MSENSFVPGYSSPIFLVDEKINESLKGKNKLTILVPYTVEMMKKIVKPYCKRVKQLANHPVPTSKIELASESLVLELKKETLQNIINMEDCDGLIAVLAVNDVGVPKPNQTFIIIPVNKKGKPLKINSAGAYGEQRWPKIHKSMDKMVGEEGEFEDKEIEERVEDYFHKTLGIK
jgi:hypothetical protein